MKDKVSQNIFDLNIFLYSNKYSKELLVDFARSKNIKNFYLINIGKLPESHSSFCDSNHQSYFSKFVNCYNFYKYVKNELSKNKKIYAIIPCTNHLLTGMLIKLYEKNHSLMHIDNVSEGTLNYCSRSLSQNEIKNRIVKKIVSILMLFPYKFSLDDNLNVISKNSKLICRNKNNIITNSQAIIELTNSVKKAPHPDNNKILLVGTHIIESDNIPISKLSNLPQELLELPINYLEYDIYYLPHPRSENFGELEKKHAYSNLNFKNIDSGLSAEEAVLKISPKIILALCGSSLFLELDEYDHDFILISWGFNSLKNADSRQAKALYKIQKQLKTLPINNFSNF